MSVFPHLIECDKPHETMFWGAQAIPTFTVEIMRASISDMTGCWKRKILKKRESFQWKKSCGQFFLVISDIKNVMEELYKGPEGNMRSIVQAPKWSFLNA